MEYILRLIIIAGSYEAYENDNPKKAFGWKMLYSIVIILYNYFNQIGNYSNIVYCLTLLIINTIINAIFNAIEYKVYYKTNSFFGFTILSGIIEFALLFGIAFLLTN